MRYQSYKTLHIKELYAVPGLRITLLQQPLVWMGGSANPHYFNCQLGDITGRDVTVLSEMFAGGFAMEAAALSLVQGDIVNWMTAKAQQRNALIIGNVALRTEPGSVNRFLLVELNGTIRFYDKHHLFRMADEHPHYKAGDARVVVEWRDQRALPLVCYNLRFPVWSCDLNGYDLALYIASWPASRSLHQQASLATRAIEDQAYVVGCNHAGGDGSGCHYRGDNRMINLQGGIIATADAHQAARVDVELSMVALREYRKKFPAWRDADEFRSRRMRVVFRAGESRRGLRRPALLRQLLPQEYENVFPSIAMTPMSSEE